MLLIIGWNTEKVKKIKKSLKMLDFFKKLLYNIFVVKKELLSDN